MESKAELGVVVIGRNEGDRLRTCLLSLRGVRHRVYVDSGSADGSPKLAEQLGFEVVDLVAPPNFTAARARNAGLQRLMELQPALKLVQMVDGDCEVAAGWLETASAILQSNCDIAAIFGRRRERFPEASIYNRLCDDEWNVPVGEARSCGGDAMFRVEALTQVGGYIPALIAGEEPDLCLRMRKRGWRVLRIDAEMTMHDANIFRFSQWWKRAQRAGHAFAELRYRHRKDAELHWRRENARILFWGGGLSAGLLLGAIGLVADAKAMQYVAAVAIALFTAQTFRLIFLRWRRGHPVRQAITWGVLMMLAKLPQLQGLVQFHARRGNSARLKLDYKS